MSNEDLLDALTTDEARLASVAKPYVLAAAQFRQSLSEALRRSFEHERDGSLRAAPGLKAAAIEAEDALHRNLAKHLGIRVPNGQWVLSHIFCECAESIAARFLHLRAQSIENASLIWNAPKVV